MAKEKESKNDEERVVPTEDSYTLTDLEQVKVLADPLRLRILEGFGFERTTKQVAEHLGEKPTRLYHHVEALERIGVIRQTRTRQNRGTLEKYYLAVAKTFRAGAELFAQGEADEAIEELQSVVSTLMGRTTDELRSLIASGKGDQVREEGILTFVEVHAPPERIREVQEQFKALVEDLSDYCDPKDLPENSRRYRLTIAYFPLDADEVLKADS